MALTKEDIETAIAQTENQDAIRHSLSNYFEGLEEPVAVAIGIGESQWDRTWHPQNVDKLVNLLRSKGIDAVSFLDPQASRPDKYVVNGSGVLCPFMSPQDSLKVATLIGDTVINDGYQIVGHINPQSSKNILYTADSSIKIKNDAAYAEQGINLKASHPDKELFNEIERRNGGDYKSFIDRKINEAYAGSKVVDFNSIDMENVYQNGMAELYRGGTLGANPYATISEWNSRKVAHSSPAISVCAGFSGKGRTLSSRGGGVYEKTKSGIEYGFIYQLESMGDEQRFYHNVGLETGDNPRTKNEVNYMVGSQYDPWNGHNGQIYESPILPHHNKLKEMYIYVGKRGEQEAKLYSIPLDENGKIIDSEWQDFMALHEPTDDKVQGYLKDRQDTQKREQTENPQHTYNFELKQDLQPDNQEYLDDVSTKDFVRNFIHDGEIQEKDGKLYIDAVSDGTSFDMAGLKLRKFPDLSDVKINGHLSLNSNTMPEVDATRLPECTRGMSTIGMNIKNVSELSADKFLKIIGAETQKEPFDDYFSVQEGSYNSLSCDGMPQGWEKLKFMQLPHFVDLVYDSMDKVPETLRGIGLAGITVKDQSSIENMSANDFIYKIKGNLGTHPLGFDVGVMYSEGIRHTEIHDNIELNLEHTNIGTFPKDMKDLTLRRIVLNHEIAVTSLDNFPTTKEGVLDLNFNGDLKNETMESFLLKTKGTEWVKDNTSKAADGHLIINCDFDFKTNAWGTRDRPKMNITSFPKDVLDVEFNGTIKPDNLRSNLYKLRDIEKQKSSEMMSLDVNYMSIDLDLSAHQGKSLNLYNYNNSVVLPPKLTQLSICDCENYDISAIKSIPDTLEDLSFNNTRSGKLQDLSFMKGKNISLENSHFTDIKFPEDLALLKLNNTQIENAVKFSDIKEFNAKNMNFPQGCIFELSGSKQVSLENCSFAKGTVLDLSKCERVNLSNIDLSQVDVILPQSGRVYIEENVKFAPDYKLDLSKNEGGFVHHSVECAEVKLPQKIVNDRMGEYIVPKQVKEITTTCIKNSYCKLAFPPHITIIDTPDNNGKKVPLKQLKTSGLSKEQISSLRKERFMNMFRLTSKKTKSTNYPQISAEQSKVAGGTMEEKSAALSAADKRSKTELSPSDKEKIAALSGRSGTRPKSKQTEADTSIQGLYKNRDDAVSQPAQTAEEQKQTGKLGKKLGSFMNALRNGRNLLSGGGMGAGQEASQPALQQTQAKEQTNASQQSNITKVKITPTKTGRE